MYKTICILLLFFISFLPLHSYESDFYYALFINGEYEKAINLLKPLAEAGNALVQYDLGILYLDYLEDYELAFYWLYESAAQYYIPSEYIIGTMYEKGLGVNKDINKAIEFYERAANAVSIGTYGYINGFEKKYSAKAKYRLGMISLYNGDYRKTLNLLHAAAKQKNDSARFQLAKMYEEGIGVAKNNKKASKYYLRLLRNNHEWNYGITKINKKNDSKHVGWKRIKTYHPEASYRFAKMCLDGRYGYHDFFLARKYFQEAASAGHTLAQMELGLLYKRGLGGKKDRQKAIQWLSKASQQGIAEAQYHLAVMLEQDKDTIQAKALYLKAWKNGFKLNEPLLKKRGIIIPVDTIETPPLSKRIALLLGNDDYPDNTLYNPRNDVWAIKGKLDSLGFESYLHINLKRVNMEECIRSFLLKAKECEVALFFYAGHSSQDFNDNYLYPAKSRGLDIRKDCLSLNAIIKSMNNCDNRHNIIIIDACRQLSRGDDIPFMNNLPRGFCISLSTDVNNVAEDGYVGQNSPYTKAFLRALSIPKLNIVDVLEYTKHEVEYKSHGYQVPCIFNTLYNGDQLILNKGE